MIVFDSLIYFGIIFFILLNMINYTLINSVNNINTICDLALLTEKKCEPGMKTQFARVKIGDVA